MLNVHRTSPEKTDEGPTDSANVPRTKSQPQEPHAVTSMENRLRAVTAEFISGLADGCGPGVLTTVTRGGEVIHSHAIGLADINHAVPLGPRSIVRVASQTKQFTTLMLLMLEADGALSMRDEVHDHLSWLPRFDHPVRLHHLASNTSGLWDSFDLLTLAGTPPEHPSTTDIIRHLLSGQRQLNFEPGSQAMYCNTGFILLSEVIEAVTGCNYEHVLAERVTGPLGMLDTQLVRSDAEAGERRAAHYTKVDAAWHHLQWGMELTGEGGAATSMHDLLLWQASLRRPDARMAKHVETMTADRLLSNGSRSPYGLGMVQGSYRGRRWIGHGGSVVGARSISQYYPDEDLGIVVLANTDSILASDLARRLADAVLDSNGPAPVGARLAGRAGLYRQVGGDDVFELVEAHGDVRFRSSNGSLGLEVDGDVAIRPAKSVFELTFAPSDDPAALNATWCGEDRIYRRLSPYDGAPVVLAGRYSATFWDASLAIAQTGPATHRFDLRSSYGAFSGSLVQVADDLHLVLGGADGQHPGRSWMATLKVEGDRVLFNTDRTKRVPFFNHE